MWKWRETGRISVNTANTANSHIIHDTRHQDLQNCYYLKGNLGGVVIVRTPTSGAGVVLVRCAAAPPRAAELCWNAVVAS